MRGTKRILCTWLLQVAALFTILLFFLWLALRPSEPTYTLAGLSVSTANATSRRSVSLALEMSNRNLEARVHYGEAKVTLSSGGDILGAATVPSFLQGHGRSKRWEGTVPVERWPRRGWLRVGVVTRVRYRILAWEMRPVTLDLERTVPIGADGRVSWDGTGIALRRTR